jgi:hypothetical protein
MFKYEIFISASSDGADVASMMIILRSAASLKVSVGLIVVKDEENLMCQMFEQSMKE